jgi:hypothetical protein
MKYFKSLFEDDFIFDMKLNKSTFTEDKSICPIDPLSIPIVYRCLACNHSYFYKLEEGKIEEGDFYCIKHREKLTTLKNK